MTGFDQFAIQAMTVFAGLFVHPAPPDPNWTTLEDWHPAEVGYVYKAESKRILDECRLHPTNYIEFPMVMWGAHEILLDGQTVMRHNEKTFRLSHAAYGAPTMRCEDVASGSILEWRIYALAKCHSTFKFLPKLNPKLPVHNLFGETLNLIASGVMVVIALFVFLIFFRRVDLEMTLSVGFSSLFFAGFFAGIVAGFWDLTWSPLVLHQLVDLSLWAAFLLICNALRLNGFISRTTLTIFGASTFVAIVLISISKTSDGVQFGTNVPFLPGAFIMISATGKKFRQMIRSRYSRKEMLELVSVFICTCCCLNDIGMVSHLVDTVPVIALGAMGGIMLFVFSVNDSIYQTYRERNYLQKNLEVEVQNKTFALQNALAELHTTQNEILYITSQVAHDIRSPLAALRMFSQNLPEVSEEKRSVLRMAVGRVNDIANSNAYRKFYTNKAPTESKGAEKTVYFASLVDKIVTEKRIQYRHRLELEIQFTPTQKSYGIFVKLDEVEIQRVLSNLIDNAAESIEGPGKVQLELLTDKNLAHLKVVDSGKGIPPDLIEKLGARGVTFGKVGGSGLGLFHATENLRKWNGELKIDSKVGRGTCMTMIMPLTDPPSWFVPTLSLRGIKNIVVIDDDVSIHDVWDNAIRSARQTVGVVHLSAPDQFEDWVGAHGKSGFLFLVDYEFLGSSVNGLDLIIKLGLASESVLVTSHWDDEGVVSRCARSGVRILPKQMAGLTPVLGS